MARNEIESKAKVEALNVPADFRMLSEVYKYVLVYVNNACYEASCRLRESNPVSCASRVTAFGISGIEHATKGPLHNGPPAPQPRMCVLSYNRAASPQNVGAGRWFMRFGLIGVR
jgi:hypothetical protein